MNSRYPSFNNNDPDYHTESVPQPIYHRYLPIPILNPHIGESFHPRKSNSVMKKIKVETIPSRSYDPMHTANPPRGFSVII